MIWFEQKPVRKEVLNNSISMSEVKTIAIVLVSTTNKKRFHMKRQNI